MGVEVAQEYDVFDLSVLQVLQQVCLTHPPFPVKEHGVMLALIRDEISALQRALAPIG